MRIAVTYENGKIFQHFGHTEQFKVYETKDGKVISSRIVGTDGNGHEALAGLLSQGGIDVLICGGIGGGARMALDRVGVKLYGGVSGDADEAVENLLSGSLNYDPDVMCKHHEEHGGECGDHNCADHNCENK